MNNRVLISIGVLIVVAAGYLVVSNQKLTPNETSQSVQQETESASQSTESASLQPSDTCSGKQTIAMTQGPYYKSGSPMRSNLLEEGIPGEKLTVVGYVFTTDCEPIANAWLDFWQADGNGVYDNAGFKLRGHQFTDESGKYILETVVSGRYHGRTPHIHVKIRATDKSPIITSQMYFSGESQNQNDAIFDASAVMHVQDGQTGKVASYNFVVKN